MWMRDHQHSGDGGDPNASQLLQIALVGAFAVLLASTVPPALFPAALSSCLMLAAVVAVAVALARGEQPTVDAPTLNHWDQAAALMLGSLLAKSFVDPDRLPQLVETAVRGAA